MPPVRLTILGADGAFHVSVDIGADEHRLGVYATASLAGAAARKWVEDRALRFGPNSARVLDRAQRLGASCVTFEVVTIEQYDIVTDAAAHAWVEVSEGILPWPFMP